MSERLVPRVPADNRLYQTAAERDLAAVLRLLLDRVEGGQGEDRDLGLDIVDALGLPRTIGDPTSCIDCALAVADELRQCRVDALAAGWTTLRGQITAGKIRKPEVGSDDFARTILSVVLRVHIARLEACPA